MRKTATLAILISSHYLSFGQSSLRLEKDIDFDAVIDTLYIDSEKSTIACKLSSKNFEKTESRPMEIGNNSSGFTDAKNGFEFQNNWMRTGCSNQFRYNRKTQKIELIGMSRYAFGNAVHDGSGESSINLLTDDYIGNWNYYDDETDELREIPAIKTKMYFSEVSLEDFSENTYFNFAEACAELYSRFKQIDINGRNLIESGQKAIHFKEFKPNRIDNFRIQKFHAESAFQLNSFKVICGQYEPEDGQVVPPDTETDQGNRLLLLNHTNEVIYRSDGVGDLYLFEPHFYKSETSNTIVILCQLAFEYYCGAEAFLYKNGTIEHMGYLDIESDSEEKSLTDMVEISEKNGKLFFSFRSNALLLEPGAEDILVENTGFNYVYDAGKKLKLIKEARLHD